MNLTDAQLRELYDDCKTHLHRMKDGSRIPLPKMTDSHLENTIKFYERRAQEGLNVGTIIHCYDYDTVEEYYSTLFGEEALKVLNYKLYVAERLRRREANLMSNKKRDLTKFVPLDDVMPGDFVMVKQDGDYHLRCVTRCITDEIGSGSEYWTRWGTPLRDTHGRLVEDEATYLSALAKMTWLNIK